MRYLRLFSFAIVFVLSACASRAPVKSSYPSNAETATNAKESNGVAVTVDTKTLILPKANSNQGGYYQDDGPGDVIPANLEATLDPIPRNETIIPAKNKPYVVKGKTYTPIQDNETPFVQQGLASWYGKKFHGRRTASGEAYDMYKITAAHPTLPIPSYARVTNLANRKQVIVRINDRGPFHAGRVIDLSFTAALKLDILAKGNGLIEVERLLPRDIAIMEEHRTNQKVSAPRMVVQDAVEKQVDVEPKEVDPLAQFLVGREATGAVNGIEAIKPIATSDSKLNNKPQLEASAGYYVQFGSYGILANAQNNLTALQRRLGTAAKLEIVQQGRLYRLQSGPYESREAAVSFASANTRAGQSLPLVIQR
jgi:rare lipoprotein A